MNGNDYKQHETDKNAMLKNASAVALLMLPAVTGTFLPLLQYIIPAAVVCLTLSEERKASFLIAGAVGAGIIASILSGNLSGVPVIIQNGGLAFIISVAALKGWSGPWTMLSGTIFLLVTLFVSLNLATGANPVEVMKAITSDMSLYFDKSLEEYKALHQTKLPEEFDIWFNNMKLTLIDLFPGIIGCSLAGASLSNVLLTRSYLKKLFNISVLKPGFTKWQFPEWLIWGVISFSAMAIVGDQDISRLGRNGMLLFGALYLLQGIALLQYYFKTLKVPSYLRWLTWIILAIQWFGLLLIAAAGILCTWFDLRALIDKKAENAKKDK